MSGEGRRQVPDLAIAGLSVPVGDRRLIEHLSLRARAGEVVGVVGPNGSGKTTLLRAVYRALRPTAGSIHLAGDDLLALPARAAARRLAAMAQESAGDFEFTVHEIVMMGRTPHQGRFGREAADDRAHVDGALARVGLSELADRRFPTLSGGEKQRALLARALAQDTGLLVLDEPTNHLDIAHQLELLALVRELGVTVLLTLHDLNLAAACCDRLHVLHAGAVVASGPPAEVLVPALLAEVFGVRAVVLPHPVTGTHQLLFVPPGRPPARAAPITERPADAPTHA